jgi:hypothetical protein
VLSKYMALLSLSTSLPYSGPGGPCYLGPGGGLYSGSSVEKSKIWGRQESARERREEKSAFTDIATRLRSEHSIAWTLTCFFVGRLTALKKLHPPIPQTFAAISAYSGRGALALWAPRVGNGLRRIARALAACEISSA